MNETKKHRFKFLGENLNRLRREKQISLDELSKITGIRKNYLQKIEKGEAYGLRTTHFFIIAYALKIPPHKLAEGI